MEELSHIDRYGRARMVDVADKPFQRRRARATGRIRLRPETVAQIASQDIAKGEVLTCAELAGVLAGKRCSDLIPLCHPLPIARLTVTTELAPDGVQVIAEAITTAQTGIEMEVLTATSIALLTIWDMCKAVDTEMVIEDIRLLEKTKETSP